MSIEAHISENPTLPDDATLLNRIRDFVADAADCPVGQVGPDTDLYEELRVDSLGAAAIFIDISYEFKIPEPAQAADFALLNTPSKIVLYIRAASTGEWHPAPSFELDVPREVRTILPYGDAFRFVDSVVSVEVNRIVTETTWNPENPLVAAHFEHGPHVVPGVLLAEQVAQSALLLARVRGLVVAGEELMLSRLRCDFAASAEPPVTIRTVVDLRATGFGHFGFIGSCTAGETEFARVKGIASKKARAPGK
jgi:acyl carrier protein